MTNTNHRRSTAELDMAAIELAKRMAEYRASTPDNCIAVQLAAEAFMLTFAITYGTRPPLTAMQAMRSAYASLGEALREAEVRHEC